MNVLLVRLSSMGDLIHTLPAISDLAAHRPDVQLDWLAEAAFADIARLHPFVRQVWPMRWRHWRRHLFQAATWQEISRLKRQLHQSAYDQVVDSQGLLKSALFARLPGRPVAGLDQHSAREPLAARFYQQRFAVVKGENAIWRNRALFAQIFDYPLPTQQNFGLRIPDGVDLPSHLPPQYHVCLHATSQDSKLWPPQHWRGLMRHMHAQDGLPILLPWGNEMEYQRALSLAADLPFVSVCPKLNLLQAALLLSRAQSVIGVDTGLLHLANAFGRPVVGIYLDSEPALTGVQESAWAQNIGGRGQSPSQDAVAALWQQVSAAVEAA